MKRFSAILLLFISILALSCSTGREKPETLTLVTYNIGNFGKYTDDSTPEVAAALTALQADIVGLNELDSCNRRHNVHQLKVLAETLGGLDYVFARAFPFADGAYGNGIVSRDSILHTWQIALPKGKGAEPRSVAVVETERCVFASTHLDYKDKEAQTEQARLINAWFEEHFGGSGKPVFLCGDMNALPESPTIGVLSTTWTLLTPPLPSFPSGEPVKCIDYIFALKSAKAVEVTAARQVSIISREESDAPAQHLSSASDHLPVMAVVQWR